MAGCRSSIGECRQVYATRLLSSVKSQASSPSRIILSYRHRGRARPRSVGHTPWLGPRSPAVTAECCHQSAFRLDRLMRQSRPYFPLVLRGEVPAQRAEGSSFSLVPSMTPPSPQRLGYKPRDGATSPLRGEERLRRSGIHSRRSYAITWGSATPRKSYGEALRIASIS